jgi:serine/threonine protein kinase
MRAINREYLDPVELGSGAQGTVFRVRQKSLGRLVALKRTRAASRQDREEILQHLSRLSTLAIPGIPRILDVFSDKNCIWCAHEYFEGITLADAPWQDWPPAMRITLFCTIAAAVGRLHSAGWSHGDLKPSNILLTRAGEVLLLDMGFSHHASQAAPNEIKGTPAFMAPEIAAGKTGDPIRADLYALGVIGKLLISARASAGLSVTLCDDMLADRAASYMHLLLSDCPLDRPPACAIADAVPHQSSSLLPTLIAPSVEAFIADAALSAARRALSRRRPEAAYRFLSEIIDRNPDHAEALALLEKIPQRKTRPLMALLFTGIFIIAFMAAAVTVRGRPPRPAPPVLADSLQEEYLERTPSPPTVARADRGSLLDPPASALAFGSVEIRGTEANDIVMVDGHKAAANPLSLAAGAHRMIVLRDSVVLREEIVTVLPYQHLSLKVAHE